MSEKKMGRPVDKYLRVGKTATGRALLTITGKRLTEAGMDAGDRVELISLGDHGFQVNKVFLKEEVSE